MIFVAGVGLFVMCRFTVSCTAGLYLLAKSGNPEEECYNPELAGCILIELR
jgi:hypothetical protein